jgi:DNA helicase II / ATP-dependent DNA helicase PcrA
LPDELEEERRLMFVGITRAKQELQISRAVYRDFRGQRRMTIPSRFLMELPREDMQVIDHEEDVASAAWPEPVEQAEPTRPSPPSRPVARSPLLTAAEMTNGGDSPQACPDDFSQGMLVRHPQNGLGRIVALSGIGQARVATVDFASPPCRMRFPLAQGPLRPVRSTRSQTT